MAELSHSDLPASVRALFADDDAAQEAIDAVLAAARRYCGWVVSPVATDAEVVVDGPGGRVLSLPTLKLISVSAVDEDGIELGPGDLRVSQLGLVRKRSGGSWTSAYGAITAKITHGYTEDEAKDWRRAVVKLVGQREQSSRDSGDLKRKKVDDVEYEWFEGVVSVDSELSALFAPFRILPAP
ncbi:hypothetical protein [Mycolicibacterium fortuitum]|uniref:hypothetical protein n=1 Tax=Mycolicibacterium fortuitum TaxID=1766 RepID=UPI00096CABAE|nr:hypothetical protein [Mycolicibacterium fortuitum]OMC02170.1 hypothetical protein A5734_15000 [Mycolicibacterium fortuitum]